MHPILGLSSYICTPDSKFPHFCHRVSPPAVPWLPGAPLTNFNDGGGGGGGGSDRGSYFIPKKITTSEFAYPKKSLLFLAYPKKSLSPFCATQKIPSLFFATQKNPGVFHKPKRITFGQNFRPKKITRTPPSLKYVSGPLGLGCYF